MELETIILFTGGALLSVAGYLMKNKVETMEADIKDIRHEMSEFKTNYLDRFERVNKNISDSKIEIVKEIGKLYAKINEKNGQ